MRRELCWLVVLAATVSACTGPAQDQGPGRLASTGTVNELVRADPRGDARWDIVGESGPLHPAPARADVDILRMQVHHGAEAITVTLTARDLPRNARLSLVLIHHFVTPDEEGHWKLGVSPGMPYPILQAPGSAQVRRCGITAAFDPARDVTTTVVPTRCFDDPAWVRVGSSLTGGALRAGGRRYHDVALRRGDTVARYRSELLPVSRRIPRP